MILHIIYESEIPMVGWLVLMVYQSLLFNVKSFSYIYIYDSSH